MSDSDSAPEDVTFEAARAVALSHIKDATKAIEEQREKTKIARKRKMEFLKQQRENKLQRMKELESHKLPEEFLEDLATSEPKTDENPVTNERSVTEEKPTYDRYVANNDHNTRKFSNNQQKEKENRHNTRKVFDDQPKKKKTNRKG